MLLPIPTSTRVGPSMSNAKGGFGGRGFKQSVWGSPRDLRKPRASWPRLILINDLANGRLSTGGLIRFDDQRSLRAKRGRTGGPSDALPTRPPGHPPAARTTRCLVKGPAQGTTRNRVSRILVLGQVIRCPHGPTQAAGRVVSCLTSSIPTFNRGQRAVRQNFLAQVCRSARPAARGEGHFTAVGVPCGRFAAGGLWCCSLGGALYRRRTVFHAH